MKKNAELYKFYLNLDRSLFIENESSKAYLNFDNAFAIECGQTISQPSLVYSMTNLLDLEKTHRVLEIGTGSGYQTAFLSAFSKMVFTVERAEEVEIRAKERLEQLGYHNIHYKIGDGSDGWPEQAPYDRILVTVASHQIPKLLLKQLALNGKMILPVGETEHQELLLIIKDESGKITEEHLGDVMFVDLKSDYGCKE
ncbi:MAG: protein-L-isoaspartate(D-aspartate) O-methyltransferase [Acetobacterium sp.]